MGFKTDLQSNNIDLQTILDTINTLPEGGGGSEQATPEISVGSNGLITAVAGDKSATKQLSTQSAKTIMPTITNQTAVASGKYTTGAITVKGDANLVAGNIKQGVSIFGVNGTLQGGGGGSSGEVEVDKNIEAIIDGTITNYTNSRVTTIGVGAFHHCYSLASVNFPLCINISNYAFAQCTSLASASFPACLYIGSYAFTNCYNLVSLYLTGSSLCTLSNSNTFASTPIGGYSASAGCYGSIYVPQSLLASYKTATNWTYFSSRFVGIEVANIITFTIYNEYQNGGGEYQAEEGMTWAEWCDSEYNTNNYYIDEDDTVYTEGTGIGHYVCDAAYNLEIKNNVIIPNYTYTISL